MKANDMIRQGLFLNKDDLTPDEIEHINDYDVVISLQDMGHRGNFTLVPKINGLKNIVFRKGVRFCRNVKRRKK